VEAPAPCNTISDRVTALLLIFTSSIVVRAQVHSFEGQHCDAALNVSSAQAIVVLGGPIHMPSAKHHLTGLVNPTDRLLVAFRLYRAGKAPLAPILFT
jgi:hypothetical protein